MSVEKAAKIAKSVAFILSSYAKAELPSWMKDYPKGCCADASHIVGECLIRRGIEGVELVFAERGSRDSCNWTSHAWLEYKTIIIDVTICQFDKRLVEVIYPINSRFHSSFAIQRRQNPTLADLQGPVIEELQAFSDKIGKLIPC